MYQALDEGDPMQEKTGQAAVDGRTLGHQGSQSTDRRPSIYWHGMSCLRRLNLALNLSESRRQAAREECV